VDVTVSIRFSCVLLLVMRIACLLYSLKSCQQDKERLKVQGSIQGLKNKKTQNIVG